MFAFPPPLARSARGVFSGLHCENLVRVLEAEVTKCGAFWDI